MVWVSWIVRPRAGAEHSAPCEKGDLFLINKCCERKTNSPQWGSAGGRGEQRSSSWCKKLTVGKQLCTFLLEEAHTSRREARPGLSLSHPWQASGKLQARSMKTITTGHHHSLTDQQLASVGVTVPRKRERKSSELQAVWKRSLCALALSYQSHAIWVWYYGRECWSSIAITEGAWLHTKSWVNMEAHSVPPLINRSRHNNGLLLILHLLSITHQRLKVGKGGGSWTKPSA